MIRLLLGAVVTGLLVVGAWFAWSLFGVNVLFVLVAMLFVQLGIRLAMRVGRRIARSAAKRSNRPGERPVPERSVLPARSDDAHGWPIRRGRERDRRITGR